MKICDLKQYQFAGRSLKLKVKKAPLIVRSFMFIFAFLCFISPLSGMILYMASGNGFHIGFLFGFAIFGLMGFYLLRVSLWNTYGNETLYFSEKYIQYAADYGWFKDGKKQIEIASPIVYTINLTGYQEDNFGLLVLSVGKQKIVCATKMPITLIEELIIELSKVNMFEQKTSIKK